MNSTTERVNGGINSDPKGGKQPKETSHLLNESHMPPPTPRCSSVWTSLYRIPVPGSSLEGTHFQGTKTAIPLLETTPHATFVCSRGWRSRVYSWESPAWGALHRWLCRSLAELCHKFSRINSDIPMKVNWVFLFCARELIFSYLFSPWSLLYEIINCECLQENDLSCLKFFPLKKDRKGGR